jgi:hypothetical protein
MLAHTGKGDLDVLIERTLVLSRRRVVRPLAALCLATVLAGCPNNSTSTPAPPLSAESAGAETYHGRAVHYLDSETPCPKIGLGSRSERACLRIGIDDENSTVVLDRAKHKITFRNEASYPEEKIVGDVVMPGWAVSASGRTPTGIHVVFRKKKDEFNTKIYSHAVTREKATKVELENYVVAFNDGKTETVVLTQEQAEEKVMNPGIAAKAAGFLFEIIDNLAKGADANLDPKPLGDITVAIGEGSVADNILRGQFFQKHADAELRISALSDLVPKYIVQRDLFLYGLEDAPVLAEVKKRGLNKGENIVVTVKDGKGTVDFCGQKADLPGAANSIRDFLQTAGLGMLLAHQAKLDAH